MKELRIEEKAKAYDEAKARMSRAFNSNRCTIGFMNEIFPELRENWDERIRTKLIEFFSGYNTDEEWWGSITEKDILAWLEKQGESTDIPTDAVLDSNKDGLIADTIRYKREKQGEQKPVDKVEPKFKVGDIIRHKEQRCTCKITAVDTTTAEYRVSECSGTHLPFDFQDAWELVEQKPVEWSIFDYRTWQHIVSDVFTKRDGIGQYLDDGECKKIAKYMQEEWSKRLGVKQRTTELPKGQDYGIDGLYAAIDILTKTLGEVDGYQTDDGILEHECAISAVKELSKQQKSFWSDEDEKQARQIERIVHDDGCTQKLQKQIADWFKSLKDRVKPWKPSDEQIKVCKEVYADILSAKGFGLGTVNSELNRLEEELKKLKG